MMLIQHHKASEYYDRAIDQFEQLYADAAGSARIMALVVHPYIMGAPHRLKYFRDGARPYPPAPRRPVLDRRGNPRLVSAGGWVRIMNCPDPRLCAARNLTNPGGNGYTKKANGE